MLPSVGRIVHVRAADGQCRPAIIVRVWGDGPTAAVNLQAFTDGTNDREASGVRWVTSATLETDDDHSAWRYHWPERVEEAK